MLLWLNASRRTNLHRAAAGSLRCRTCGLAALKCGHRPHLATPIHPSISSSATIHSLSLPQAAYVHLPFCKRKCFYCDFPVVATGSRLDAPEVQDSMQVSHCLILSPEAAMLQVPHDAPACSMLTQRHAARLQACMRAKEAFRITCTPCFTCLTLPCNCVPGPGLCGPARPGDQRHCLLQRAPPAQPLLWRRHALAHIAAAAGADRARAGPPLQHCRRCRIYCNISVCQVAESAPTALWHVTLCKLARQTSRSAAVSLINPLLRKSSGRQVSNTKGRL